MARFVISDIHGAHKALLQCFERSGFKREKDLLICLGDVCDGYTEVKNCFDELLSVNNLVYIMGNHDLWCLDWAKTGKTPDIWLIQGGYSTIRSYKGSFDPNHYEFLKNAKPYYISDNLLFVHGGFDVNKALEKQNPETFTWDRNLVFEAYTKKGTGEKITGFDKIFVGHTPTLNFNSMSPVQFCEVMLTDTGAGWGQKLSIINIDTGKVFQSDPTMDLYPAENGR